MKNKGIIVLLVIFIQILFFPLFAKVVLVEKAGKLKKVLSKENLEQTDSLTIIGEINGTDILTLKKMFFLKHLDLRKCRIKKGGKIYYNDKYKKLKLKTQDDIFTPYLFVSRIKSLQSIVLPESLLSVEKNSMNLELKSVHITGDNTRFLYYSSIDTIWSKTIFILDSYNMLNCLPFKGNWVKHIEICNGSIDDMAFLNYEYLNSIVLGENILSLGEAAFQGCVNLTNIDIRGSVSELKESTFEGCSVLKKIKLRDGLERIKDHCFYGCSSLVDVEIPNTVSLIGNSAFEGCKSLSNFNFSKELNMIGSKCFANTNLSLIKLPISLSYIGNYAWEKCPLERIEYPENILDIGENDFSPIDNLSIYMNSIHKPLGSINGLYTNLFVPNGSFENYQKWSDQAYIVDVENPICKTFDLDKGYDFKAVRYADTLKICGEMNSESFGALMRSIRMVKCLDFSEVKYTTSNLEIGVARSSFLEGEKKKKEDKDLSEFLGLLAAGTSLYAEYFMDPITGTLTKIIADEVQKSMDEDVRKYEEIVFCADTVKNNLVLSNNLSHIRNLSSIYLPSYVDNLWVNRKGVLPLNLYVSDPCFFKLNVIFGSNVKFFIPAKYEHFVKNNPDWKGLIYHFFNSDSIFRKIDTLAQSIDVQSEKIVFEKMIFEWNKKHQLKDVFLLESLYAKNVNFYGQQLSLKDCLDRKNELMCNDQTFSQSLLGNIICTTLNNGDVLCDFNKSVKMNGKAGIYPSYLVFRKIDGEWKIVTESDKQTDAYFERLRNN